MTHFRSFGVSLSSTEQHVKRDFWHQQSVSQVLIEFSVHVTVFSFTGMGSGG